MKDRKQEGHHDYDGACKPGKFTWASQTAFSVSVFRWVAKASGKGLKKSASVYRIKGTIAHPERVYERAEEVCDMLDRGETLTGKSETVKR